MSEPEGRLLRIAFLVGAAVDAGALFPMLFPPFADLVWGFHERSAAYRFAMDFGASLMLGWSVLLFWASRRPCERRRVAAVTALVIAGLSVAEIRAVEAGVASAVRMLPTWLLEACLFVLFLAAFRSGRSPSEDSSGTGV